MEKFGSLTTFKAIAGEWLKIGEYMDLPWEDFNTFLYADKEINKYIDRLRRITK